MQKERESDEQHSPLVENFTKFLSPKNIFFLEKSLGMFLTFLLMTVTRGVFLGSAMRTSWAGFVHEVVNTVLRMRNTSTSLVMGIEPFISISNGNYATE